MDYSKKKKIEQTVKKVKDNNPSSRGIVSRHTENDKTKKTKIRNEVIPKEYKIQTPHESLNEPSAKEIEDIFAKSDVFAYTNSLYTERKNKEKQIRNRQVLKRKQDNDAKKKLQDAIRDGRIEVISDNVNEKDNITPKTNYKGVVSDNTGRWKNREISSRNTAIQRRNGRNAVSSGRIAYRGRISGSIKNTESKNKGKKKKGFSAVPEYMQYKVKEKVINAANEGKEAGSQSKSIMKISAYVTGVSKKVLGTVMLALKAAVESIIKLFMMISPVLALCVIFPLIAIWVLNIPPFSWAVADTDFTPLIVSYETRMKEFGVEIDNCNPDRRTTINNTVDINELRKDAFKIFLAKKGSTYDISKLSAKDAAEYAEICAGLMRFTSTVTGFSWLEDGAFYDSKKVVQTIRAGSGLLAQDKYYVSGSCNRHGVQAVSTSNGVNYSTRKYFFIPCEVSRYSSVPVGTCFEISTEIENVLGSKKYILMVVDNTIKDEEKDVDNLYICGDMRLTDNMGKAYDTNMKTTAYGDLSYFSVDWFKSRTGTNSYTEQDGVTYTGIFDKAIQTEDGMINLVYRSPQALVKEFEMSDTQAVKVFKSYFDNVDTSKLDDKELVETLKDAGVIVPKKEINILRVSADEYVKDNFDEAETKEWDNIKELIEENEDLFNSYFERIFGLVSGEVIQEKIESSIGSTVDGITNMSKYVAQIYTEYGMYLPSEASVMAKYMDDQKMTYTDAKNMQTGDIIFLSFDTGTYKNVTDIVVKSTNGYLKYADGVIKEVTSINEATMNKKAVYGQIVMYGRIKK